MNNKKYGYKNVKFIHILTKRQQSYISNKIKKPNFLHVCRGKLSYLLQL